MPLMLGVDAERAPALDPPYVLAGGSPGDVVRSAAFERAEGVRRRGRFGPSAERAIPRWGGVLARLGPAWPPMRVEMTTTASLRRPAPTSTAPSPSSNPR